MQMQPNELDTSMPDEVYEVTVWGYEGIIVKKLWQASWDEAEAVRKEFEDDPLCTVVVEMVFDLRG